MLIKDNVGRGLFWANSQIHEIRQSVKGEYVYVLDDDDCLIYKNFISDLKKIHKELNPDIVIVKGYIGGKLYPPQEYWGKNVAVRGTIGSPNFVVSNKIYQNLSNHWCQPRAGDYFFISKAFKVASKVHWLDKIVFDAPIGACRPENGNNNPIRTEHGARQGLQ